MKKYTGYFLVAVLGGFFALAGYSIYQKKTRNLEGVPIEKLPVQLASLSGTGGNYPDFTLAANNSIHAVVHIKTAYSSRNNAYDNFFNFRDFFGDNSPFGGQQPIEGAGSGVIITPDGYIVTNNHVVEDASKIEVVLNDKRSYTAEVVGTDPSTDLAVIRIKESGLPYLTYGNSDDLQIGEWVLAVGNPFNLTSTVTAGIVSAKARNIDILGSRDGSSAIESYIQTDAAVNRGNSGGALVNTRGELVGINAAIASGNGFYAGYSFAIPVNIVKKVVTDLIDYKEVQRAFLGVNIREIDSKFANEQGIKELRGVYVAGVNDGSAAQVSGISKGDIITSINKVNVNSTSELLEQVSRYRPGDKISVGVSRDGKDKQFEVALRNRDGNMSLVKAEERDMVPLLGASLKAPSAETLTKLGIDHGVQVSQVSDDGLLANAGIRDGYIITEIDKKPVKTVADVNKILSTKKGGVLLEGIYPNKVKAYYGFGLN